jgi:hypothetical protein
MDLTTDEHGCARILQIPTGFRHSARRCETTPGNESTKVHTPTGFYQMDSEMVQPLQGLLIWSAATCCRFESADISAQSKIVGDDVRSLWLK